jgi:hypothetical protein
MRHDVSALQSLDSILITAHRVIGILEDSRFAAARESLGHERTVFKFLQTHHALTGKLEDALNDLAAHFAHNKPAKPDKPAGA